MADVIRNHAAEYLERYGASKDQCKVLRDLRECRTASLGGCLKRCEGCGHEMVVYHSCRNRHCPKCEGAARASWLEARQEELLDVEYFHVVFTVPNELSPLALQNRRVVYAMLFGAVSETLLTIARDAKHLGAEIGCLALLHTWGQNLHHHPHVHCVVPGGGLSRGGERWVSCRDGFFLPTRVLSRLFRGKLIAGLQQTWEKQELEFHGSLHELEHPKAWEAWLEPLRNKDWVVYAKPPFGGPERVLKYLARYTHRVAISNQRLVCVEDGKVAFRWKGNRQRIMTLEGREFLRRFLQHVLPRGFVRIRYYGFLANRQRAQNLQRVRDLLSRTANLSMESSHSEVGTVDATEVEQPFELCPQCNKGRLRVVFRVGKRVNAHQPWSFDSS